MNCRVPSPQESVTMYVCSTSQTAEHPSPLTVLPSSHTSPASKESSPQPGGVGSRDSADEDKYTRTICELLENEEKDEDEDEEELLDGMDPGVISTVQFALHPSSLMKLPSSHSSGFSTMVFPHTASTLKDELRELAEEEALNPEATLWAELATLAKMEDPEDLLEDLLGEQAEDEEEDICADNNEDECDDDEGERETEENSELDDARILHSAVQAGSIRVL